VANCSIFYGRTGKSIEKGWCEQVVFPLKLSSTPMIGVWIEAARRFEKNIHRAFFQTKTLYLFAKYYSEIRGGGRADA
jgi:hypothetical protein